MIILIILSKEDYKVAKISTKQNMQTAKSSLSKKNLWQFHHKPIDVWRAVNFSHFFISEIINFNYVAYKVKNITKLLCK
jgi:hypothetical protein